MPSHYRSVAACLVGLFFLTGPALRAGQGSSEVEPNNIRDSADEVTGLAINGVLDGEDEHDWFELQGQETSRATFNLSHGAAMDFDFEVFSGTNSVGRAEADAAVDTLTANVPGDAFIHVWRVRGAGPYTINIVPDQESDAADDTAAMIAILAGATARDQSLREEEPNDTVETADVLENTDGGVTIKEIKGSLSSANDVDWYNIEVPEGKRVSFTVTHGAGYDVDLEAYFGFAVVGRAAKETSGDRITCLRTTVIKVYSGKGSGAYSIAVEMSDRPSATSENEPNDRKNQADEVSGMIIDGTLSSSGDVDWFELEGQEGDNPGFMLLSEPEGFDVDMELYEDDDRVGVLDKSGPQDYISGELTGKVRLKVYSGRGRGAYSIQIVKKGGSR